MKNSKNQSGIAHVLLAGIVIIIVAVIGAAVWKVSSNSSSGTPKTAAGKQVESACNKSISDTTLCKFAGNFTLDTAYKAVATISSSSGNGTMTIESDGKGNTSLASTIGGQEIDSITLGSNTYIKDPSSGSWLKYATDSSNSTSASNPADGIKFSSSDITAGGTISYKNLGKQTCGSLTCYYYQVVDTATPNATQYLWFDTTNYQMQEWSYKDSNGTTDLKFTYPAVNITTPSPVVDATAGL